MVSKFTAKSRVFLRDYQAYKSVFRSVWMRNASGVYLLHPSRATQPALWFLVKQFQSHPNSIIFISKTDPKPASKDAKKAKTSTSKAPAVAKSAKAESKKALAAKAKENEEVVLVELKNGKLGLKQKALGNDSTSSTMRGQ